MPNLSSCRNGFVSTGIICCLHALKPHRTRNTLAWVWFLGWGVPCICYGFLELFLHCHLRSPRDSEACRCGMRKVCFSFPLGGARLAVLKGSSRVAGPGRQSLPCWRALFTREGNTQTAKVGGQKRIDSRSTKITTEALGCLPRGPGCCPRYLDFAAPYPRKNLKCPFGKSHWFDLSLFDDVPCLMGHQILGGSKKRTSHPCW